MNRNSPVLRSQTATPPRGDCICDCQLTQESHDNQKVELKPCGELCAEIVEKTHEYNETWTEKDDACGSGKRTYRRKTTIFMRVRSTKMEGTITLKQYRVSLLGDDWKPLSDCLNIFILCFCFLFIWFVIILVIKVLKVIVVWKF